MNRNSLLASLFVVFVSFSFATTKCTAQLGYTKLYAYGRSINYVQSMPEHVDAPDPTNRADASARVLYLNLPETSYPDVIDAVATPYTVKAVSRVSFSGTYSSGPLVKAETDGSTVVVAWSDDNKGPPATITFPEREVTFDGAYLPIDVSAVMSARACTGPICTATGELKLYAQVETWINVTPDNLVGSYAGTQSISGKALYGDSRPLSASLGGVLATLPLVSSGTYEASYAGKIYLPLNMYSESGEIPNHAYKLKLSVEASTDAWNSDFSEGGISASIGEPSARYVGGVAAGSSSFSGHANQLLETPLYLPFSQLGATVDFRPGVIPEPSSLFLLAVGATSLLGRRKR